MPSKKRKLGDLGENYACMFLVKHGFNVIQRNYLKRSGEIDIVAEKQGIIYFFEVKTVSRETFNYSRYTALDNVSEFKLEKLEETVFAYIEENNLENREVCFEVITVEFLKGEQHPFIRRFKDFI